MLPRDTSRNLLISDPSRLPITTCTNTNALVVEPTSIPPIRTVRPKKESARPSRFRMHSLDTSNGCPTGRWPTDWIGCSISNCRRRRPGTLLNASPTPVGVNTSVFVTGSEEQTWSMSTRSAPNLIISFDGGSYCCGRPY